MLYQKNQPERDQLIKDLNDLKTLFVEKGWTQGALHNNQGFCTIGGAMAVVREGEEVVLFKTTNAEEPSGEQEIRYWRMIAALSRAQLGNSTTNIETAVNCLVRRNDLCGTRLEDILATIDKAIEQCMVPVFAEVG